MAHRIALPITPLTPEHFAPFGRLLTPDGPRDAGREGYDIWLKPFASESAARLQIVRYHARPLRVVTMERHLHVTEARMPLGGPPSVIVCAPPAETLDVAGLRAFKLDGTGVLFHCGTWHAIDAYPLGGPHADFLFLSEEATVNELFLTPDQPPRRTRTENLPALGYDLVIDASD